MCARSPFYIPEYFSVITKVELSIFCTLFHLVRKGKRRFFHYTEFEALEDVSYKPGRFVWLKDKVK